MVCLDSFRLQTMIALIKSFYGGIESVGQLVSSRISKRNFKSLIMLPRLHPETNKNQHKRFAQHIGSPRRGAPGRRRQLFFISFDIK